MVVRKEEAVVWVGRGLLLYTSSADARASALFTPREFSGLQGENSDSGKLGGWEIRALIGGGERVGALEGSSSVKLGKQWDITRGMT